MQWWNRLQERAEKKLPKAIYDFIAGGADDETTVNGNITAFQQLKMIPRVLMGNEQTNTQVSLLGTSFPSPIIIAPTAPHKLVHEEGEIATVKAAGATDTLMIVSCMGSETLENIALRASSNLWLQLHIFRDRMVTYNIVKRAENAGYQALVVTVDMPIVGNRLRDINNKFKIPNDCFAANLLQENLIETDNPSMLIAKHTNNLFDSQVSWDDIRLLISKTTLPVFLKGILHPQDARKAIEIGAQGIIVSNHGGRQLGQVIPTIHALPEVVDAIDSKIPVLMDGGIRSGADILKALLLGANGVLIGRPILWGLATGGVEGVAGVIGQLNRELKQVMMLCGVSSLDDKDRSQVVVI